MKLGRSPNEQEFIDSALKAPHLKGQTDIFMQIAEVSQPKSKRASTVSEIVQRQLRKKKGTDGDSATRVSSG
jgi:hypothetical protein